MDPHYETLQIDMRQEAVPKIIWGVSDYTLSQEFTAVHGFFVKGQ